MTPYERCKLYIPARFMGQFEKYVGFHPNDTVTMPTAELFKFMEEICEDY